MVLNNKELNYLISEERYIALCCNRCKIYYNIESKNYQGPTSDICDKCYRDFVDELYYYYDNNERIKPNTIKRKKHQPVNFWPNIKKLINKMFKD